MSLKIAIAGTGGVASHNYIPFLAEQSDVSLGYFNRTMEKARAVAKSFPGEVFPSIEALAAWNPDSALVLTRETDRLEAGTALIEAGVSKLFFEKPLVAAQGQAHVSEDDFFNAKKMLDAAKARNCETAMVFNYRFFEQSLAAKKILAQRDFGEIINATVLSHYACWTHCIDLIYHFAGSVIEIVGLSGAREIYSKVLDSTACDVAAALRMKNGASATLLGTAGLQWQHPLYELTLSFERGRIHLRDLDGAMEVLDGASQTHETYAFSRDNSRWDQYDASFKKSLAAYLDSLREGSTPPVPGIDGLRELQVEAALKRSIRERRPVRVQEEFAL